MLKPLVSKSQNFVYVYHSGDLGDNFIVMGMTCDIAESISTIDCQNITDTICLPDKVFVC